ncbi:DUF1549 domain-containing protein [Planctomicrobium sp. SH664]|uniref:DUF1549 domain-containing protein n=1 Tax=Planctomicrobium sp. SH664 TaxID=3448125 RepID=UPI003F5C061F
MKPLQNALPHAPSVEFSLRRVTRWTLRGLTACLVLHCSLTASAAEIVDIQVFPAEVSLTSKSDRQSVVVQGLTADGLTYDVTQDCQWTFANDGLTRREGSTLKPAADGETQLTITHGTLSRQVPVVVKNSASDPPVSFNLDVMPILMKAGCNTGSCHGAAKGKDGFCLSLFGYDPDGDHRRITEEQPGRRINLAVPEASLMVEKAIGAVPHSGGKRFEADSEACQHLVEWIRLGVPKDPPTQITCTGIELGPTQAVLDGEGASQQLVVVAKYSDGSTRDVTALSAFLTSNEGSAKVSESGLITAGERGEAFVMARFDVYTQGAQVLTLPKGLQYEAPASEPVNFIDELVMEKLKKLRLQPSGLCTDEEFLRRVTIDLTGLLPTPDEYHAFMSSSEPDKRAKKIDELLASPEFTNVWVSNWADWLRMRSEDALSEKTIGLYHRWISEQLAANVPLDQMVKSLLTGSGGTFSVPQVTYYEITKTPADLGENVAQVFIGTRIQCAQCHNHPFDRWTQNDYYDFAAFFAQVARKNGEDPRERVIFNRGSGEVKHPVTGKNAIPRFLGGEAPKLDGRDRREILADWLVSKENPYFAKNFANRIWLELFGRGLVEPVDDFRISNPPSNPELLDALAERFIESNYDFRKLVKEICVSQTYQRSTRRNDSNRSDEANYAHQNIRRIKAESMLDILTQVTKTTDAFPGVPHGGRSKQIADGRFSSYFLTTFGRATRTTACSCEVRMEPNLSQALHLMNGTTVNAKMQQGKLIETQLQQKKPPQEIVEDLYITCLSRLPSDEERANLAPLIGEGANVQQGLEDIFWALLNSREFLFNH